MNETLAHPSSSQGLLVGTELKFQTMEKSRNFMLRVIVSGAWSICKLLHQSRSQKELVDKLGIWRIVNKASNYMMVGQVQRNKPSVCLEADVRGLIGPLARGKLVAELWRGLRGRAVILRDATRLHRPYREQAGRINGPTSRSLLPIFCQ